MNSDSKPICPCCGQDIVIPNELTSIGLRRGPLRVLFALYRSKPYLIPYDRFAISANAVKVYVSYIREALQDIGSDYYVETVSGQGYALKKREHKQEEVA